MASSRYYPADSLARRQRGFLNPIIEESDENARSPPGRRVPSHLKIQAWLSPMSDHFPTPRGNHYMAAPVVPSSPSSVSAGDTSPTASSNPWNRASTGTMNTEFEDLYDVSDDEDLPRKSLQRRMSQNRVSAANLPTKLIIPTNRDNSVETWSALEEFKKITSPVALTPSVKLSMSPGHKEFMDKQQAYDVPTISAPPSLDGSLTSEQLAAMSAPPTPVIGNDDDAVEEAWAGVHLQPGALATLHALSNDEEHLHEQPERVIEFPQEEQHQPMEMSQGPLRLVTSFASSSRMPSFSPNPNRQTLADLTKLDIPSPGGFFSGLSPRSRTTWHMAAKSPEGMAPPTSATAEQFYRCPWNIDTTVPPMPKRPDFAEDFYRSSAPVEQVIEAPMCLEEDMPTARPIFAHKISDSSEETVKAPKSPDVDDAPTEIVVDCDPDYARKQQTEALSNFDRTGMWLAAQRAYLKGVDEDDDKDTGALVTIAEALEEEDDKPEPVAESSPESKKKTVRFSTDVITTTQPKRLPSKLLRQESAYYRAFQDYIIRTQQRDVFIHQLTRFEALQAQRVSLKESHRNQLLGKYQLSVLPQSAKKRLSTNVVRGDDNLVDDPEKLRLEKEHEAMEQTTMSTWQVAAAKFLNGGRLINAPVTKRLARLSHMAPGTDGVTRDRARILDLGGQAACDWAWHCALQYPNTKVYTVTTKAIRQLSNSNIRGPPNHRQVAVERLTRLPFGDNQFDLVSARELHSILKIDGENGEDEWESCLKECMRVLKPGGYLEFSLLDSDIMNAGPLGLAKSVEFGFNLKTLGYDPSPSKMWLGRLARAGFSDTRRAWMCLPIGARRSANRPAPGPEEPLLGSSENIASVCAVVGGWSWERWLLRCEMEKVAGELRLVDTVTAGKAMHEAGKCLEGVNAIMEEGRACKAGYRMLNGYARKPTVNSGVIRVALE